jgi:hypothetical protein
MLVCIVLMPQLQFDVMLQPLYLCRSLKKNAAITILAGSAKSVWETLLAVRKHMVPGDDLDRLLSPLEGHLKTVKQHIELWSSKSGMKRFFVELGNIPVQLNSH